MNRGVVFERAKNSIKSLKSYTREIETIENSRKEARDHKRNGVKFGAAGSTALAGLTLFAVIPPFIGAPFVVASTAVGVAYGALGAKCAMDISSSDKCSIEKMCDVFTQFKVEFDAIREDARYLAARIFEESGNDNWNFDIKCREVLVEYDKFGRSRNLLESRNISTDDWVTAITKTSYVSFAVTICAFTTDTPDKFKAIMKGTQLVCNGFSCAEQIAKTINNTNVAIETATLSAISKTTILAGIGFGLSLAQTVHTFYKYSGKDSIENNVEQMMKSMNNIRSGVEKYFDAMQNEILPAAA